MISILLPVFNASPYLPDCLNSIIQQTNTNWELLAINDFSDDNSYDILNSFAEKDGRIQVFNNQEKGIIPALRLAFEKSTGDFITRMDADDLMPVNKLDFLKKKLAGVGKGHITTGYVDYFSETNLGDGYRKYQNWLNQLIDHKNHYQQIYKECVLPSPAWMMHRADLEKIGAFNVNRYPEDYDLCFRGYDGNLKIIGVPEIVHQWRDHSDRTSRNSPVYANQHFLNLKLFWFLKTDYDSTRPLVIWGAGKKGKIIARFFIEKEIPFFWVTDNPKKQDINIYSQILKSRTIFKSLKNPKTIIAVAGSEEQKEIQSFFDYQNEVAGQDYFWFC